MYGRRALAGGLIGLVLVGCGGRKEQARETSYPSGATTAAATPTPGAPAGGAAAKPATGKTWDVKMIGDATGYHFDPVSLTIKEGDAVRWTVVSGPPHNVSFWSDSIPANAATQLNANMPETTAPLSGPMRMNANETYVVSFAGVPKGEYKYYCTPHLAMGMKGAIRVE